MEQRISHFLRRIGLRGTYRGFDYLVCAVSLVLTDGTYLTSLTTRLYPEIAHRYNATISAVERSLRLVVDVFWDRGNVPLLEKAIGYSLREKPYTGEFIDIVAGYFKSRNISA